jgi:mono/diheme cytochrome c family protein
MSEITRVGALFVAAALCAAGTTSAQDRDAEEKGKAAVGQACVQCHNLRPVMLQRKTAEKWRDTVFGMIGRGAQVMPDEIEPIVSYLAASFGPQVPLQSPAPSTATLPEGPGRAVLMQRCASCHALDVVSGTRRSSEQWVETLKKMRALGATLSAEEEKVVTAYLAEHFGSPSR